MDQSLAAIEAGASADPRQLTPLNRPDDNVTVPDQQWARLQAAFPAGVCDGTQAAVGEPPSSRG